jgi:hypothetical protein
MCNPATPIIWGLVRLVIFPRTNAADIPGLARCGSNLNEDEEPYLKFARLAMDAATRLAPYQSPTLRAVVVAPASGDTEIKTKRFTLRVFDHDRELVGPASDTSAKH